MRRSSTSCTAWVSGGKTLHWIKAFLDNRSQSVVLNGSSSDSTPVSSGVPQGSVLGPLLFLVYINDIPENINSKIRLFADDTAIYLTLDQHTQSSILQADLKTLEKWESDWDMEFNPSKCQVIHVTKRKTPIPSQYFLHGVLLDSVSSAKYLGVDVAGDLSWDAHVNRISSKANQTLGFLRRNIKVKSKPLRTLAYQTLVRPQLEYGSEIWSPHTKLLIDQVEAVQRRAARWIQSDYSKTSSVSEMLNQLNLRRLDLRRIDSRLTLFYKAVNNLVDIPTDNILEPLTHRSRHNHSLSYKLPHAATDYYKFAFFPRTIFHWNSLPPDIPTMTTVEQFSAAVSRIDHVSP